MESLLELMLVLLLTINCKVVHTQQQILYVKAIDDNSPCPDVTQSVQCQTLDCYASNVSAWFSSNTEMVFLEGNHSLETFIEVSSCNNFTMTGRGNALHGNDGLPQPTSWINCDRLSNAGIHFTGSSNIHILNIGFRSCGGIYSLENFNISAALSFSSVNSISISRVVTSHALGFGIYTSNIYGTVEVQDSAFLHTEQRQSFEGGNAKFYFEKTLDHEASLTIKSSWFMYGRNKPKKNGYYTAAGGLNVYIRCSGVNVTIVNVTSHGNTGTHGGNVALYLSTEGSTIVVDRSRITGGRATKGGGLRF